ncbi:hypothetical protein [Carnobacterium antarcticum]|uniref:Lipoprotein n=1 Tax=Carnobacterium antarcticum TaxID=2126436 RepID=A0ABW4NMR0_9LACT|nr:hypothetical protein [Carnobacterium sp. CP1]ALV22240.1 hypothetical protein NY10_1641 [Carnobacterium sp. CP1]
MKKALLVFVATAFVLTGCGTNKAEAPTNGTSEQSSQTSQESSAVESSTTIEEADKEDSDMASISEEELENAEPATDISQYEELTYVQEKVDLSDYESRIVTDNPGTRVMLFLDGTKQVYKTVYVKHKQWLKVIDLQANNLVINESIQ